MKLFHLLFGLFIALLITIGVGFFIPEGKEATATVHPQIETMLQSSGGYAQKPGLLALAYLMGILMIAIMSLSVLTGWKKKNRLGNSGKLLIGSFIIFALIFTGLTFTYLQYTNGISRAFFGGFPLPTAWMLYGMWAFPIVFIIIFIANFDNWFLTEDDLTQFHKMVEANRKHEGDGS